MLNEGGQTICDVKTILVAGRSNIRQCCNEFFVYYDSQLNLIVKSISKKKKTVEA